jgi:hypothetical protein
LVAFGAWTGFVWVTRIRNAFEDDELTAGGKAAAVALAATFLAFAAATLVWCWRHRRAGLPPETMTLLVPFVAWTAVVWVIRGTGIVLGDHSAAFVVVHLALAVISVVLGVVALRSVPRPASERLAAP